MVALAVLISADDNNNNDYGCDDDDDHKDCDDNHHHYLPQLALAVLLLISPRPLSHGRPGSWAPVQVTMMTRMVMVMMTRMVMLMMTRMVMVMMMVRTNKYICKKTLPGLACRPLPQSYSDEDDDEIYVDGEHDDPANKQTKIFAKKTVSGLARSPLPLRLSPSLPSHNRRLQVLTQHPIIKHSTAVQPNLNI